MSALHHKSFFAEPMREHQSYVSSAMEYFLDDGFLKYLNDDEEQPPPHNLTQLQDADYQPTEDGIFLDLDKLADRLESTEPQQNQQVTNDERLSKEIIEELLMHGQPLTDSRPTNQELETSDFSLMIEAGANVSEPCIDQQVHTDQAVKEEQPSTSTSEQATTDVPAHRHPLYNPKQADIVEKRLAILTRLFEEGRITKTRKVRQDQL